MVSASRQRQFEALYQEHLPAVRAYLVRRAQPEPAHDALSETFLAAWRRFDDLPADPLPWLLGTARRALANQHRSARRMTGLRDRLAASEVPAGGDDLAERIADADLVRRALAGLAEPDREVLMLVAWEGLEPRQAAEVAGCSRAAFAVRLHRARGRLDRALLALETSLTSSAPDALETR